MLDQVSVFAELGRREIYSNADMIRPRRRRGASFAEHPLADRHDEARFFRDRDELTGVEKPALGMLPTEQCFTGRDAIFADVDQWLVYQPKLVVEQRGPQPSLDAPALLKRSIKALLVEMICSATFAFGPIKCQVGV